MCGGGACACGGARPAACAGAGADYGRLLTAIFADKDPRRAVFDFDQPTPAAVRVRNPSRPRRRRLAVERTKKVVRQGWLSQPTPNRDTLLVWRRIDGAFVSCPQKPSPCLTAVDPALPSRTVGSSSTEPSE